MVRMQIQLTEEQARRLKRLADARGVSMSSVVREAVDRLDGDDLDSRWQRALAVVGKYRDREVAGDVAVGHDRYLEEAYLDWRR